MKKEVTLAFLILMTIAFCATFSPSEILAGSDVSGPPVTVQIETKDRVYSYDCYTIGEVGGGMTKPPEISAGVTMVVYIREGQWLAGYGCVFADQGAIIPVPPPTTFRSVLHRDRLFGIFPAAMIILVDGGYLTWLFGTGRRSDLWNSWRRKNLTRSSLVLLDSDELLYREKEYAGYKAERRERRERESPQIIRASLVREFRYWIIEDPRIASLSVAGYEADDLVAYFYLRLGNRVDSVIAVDKDYLQLPGFPLSRNIRVPQFVRPLFQPATWALALAVFGDESDSVPRLLDKYSRGADQIRQISGSDQPYRVAYELWGDSLIRNLRLVLLPYPSLLINGCDLDSETLIRLCETGSYWDPRNLVGTEHLLERHTVRCSFSDEFLENLLLFS